MADARYDAQADWYNEFVTDPRQAFVASAVLDLIGEVEGDRLLDLACGEGRIARELARQGAQVLGVDLSTALIQIAIRKCENASSTFIIGNAADPTWWDGAPFAGVVCSVALMDIDDLAQTVDATARMLKPGGWFVASITHPCFSGGPSQHPSWPTDGNYFDEGWLMSSGRGISGRVGRNHRTLGTYLNTFAAAGLQLERVIETNPDGETWSPPLLLAMRWTKPFSDDARRERTS